jgi:hypothetical protein
MPDPAIHYVEEFHLHFLAQLGRHLDKRTHVLKGGGNLRFFLGSIRYSEDMDLDVAGVAVHELRDKVRGILRARPFLDTLRARGIEIAHTTEHKQTETTQRWKFGLNARGAGLVLPTKIEFSHRGLDDDTMFDGVDPSVVRSHGMLPFMASHYGPKAAFRQKIGALAGRPQTQARDLFDLHQLIAGGAVDRRLPGLAPDMVVKARTNALSVDFGTFKSQVLAYLAADQQPAYDSVDVWDRVVLGVVEYLEEATP